MKPSLWVKVCDPWRSWGRSKTQSHLLIFIMDGHKGDRIKNRLTWCGTREAGDRQNPQWLSAFSLFGTFQKL